MATIRFELFAPYNEAAALIGEFSGWRDVGMSKGDDGVFRAEIELDDGDYRYKFRVRSKSWFLEENAWVDVVDPYATQVDDEAIANGVVRVHGGERVVDRYAWQHDEDPLPPDHALVIYELHVGDFSGGEGDGGSGRFEDVTARLDYLADLGINAIELMPFEEFPGEHSWGYNPRHFFAPESAYGSNEDLKTLVDACHARGIRVIKDGVYNHAESASPLTQIDHDYWFHHDPRDPEFNWGPEFDYDKYDENLDVYPARKFVDDVIGHWIHEFHIDGIRFDAARQIDSYDFMRWVAREAKLQAGAKPFFNIAEYLPETPAMIGPDGPMDACWHESFYATMRAVMTGCGVDFETLEGCLDGRRKGFPGATNLVNYLANHDHNHIFADLGDAGILGDAAFKRAKLGAALLFTALGVPLLWMGQEFGAYSYKTTEPSKLEWQLLESDDGSELHATYRALIHLRKTNSALHGANIDFFHENVEAGVIAFVRWNDEGSRVVTVANISGNFLADYPIPNFPADGTWREWLNAYDIEVRDGELVTDLAEYEAKVLVI